MIDDVSLTIPEGTACAIVGPSGSGKTTLVNLMMRFWDVDAGAVMLGGEDVRSWKFDALMAHYAMVFQDVYLFGDTIENNIKFGRLDATHDEVMAVAKAARCHDFISALPQGYSTPVGEGMILVYAFTSCIHLRFFYKRRDNPSNCACFSTNNIVLPRRCGEGITTDYSEYLIELSLLRNSAYE